MQIKHEKEILVWHWKYDVEGGQTHLRTHLWLRAYYQLWEAHTWYQRLRAILSPNFFLSCLSYCNFPEKWWFIVFEKIFLFLYIIKVRSFSHFDPKVIMLEAIISSFSFAVNFELIGNYVLWQLKQALYKTNLISKT